MTNESKPFQLANLGENQLRKNEKVERKNILEYREKFDILSLKNNDNLAEALFIYASLICFNFVGENKKLSFQRYLKLNPRINIICYRVIRNSFRF